MKKILTLCLIRKDSKILLGMKRRGFGEGKWNGFGGKVEPGETLEAAIIREVLEESKLIVNNLEPMGDIEFSFENNPIIFHVHYFKTSNFTGEPKETEEMATPQWFNLNELPLDQMWPEAKIVFPKLLADKKITGKILYNQSGDAIIRNELRS